MIEDADSPLEGCPRSLNKRTIHMCDVSHHHHATTPPFQLCISSIPPLDVDTSSDGYRTTCRHSTCNPSSSSSSWLACTCRRTRFYNAMYQYHKQGRVHPGLTLVPKRLLDGRGSAWMFARECWRPPLSMLRLGDKVRNQPITSRTPFIGAFGAVKNFLQCPYTLVAVRLNSNLMSGRRRKQLLDRD
jgi:hypothetical protein